MEAKFPLQGGRGLPGVNKLGRCAIFIPVYKLKPSQQEVESLHQCCRVLGRYPIVLVTHEGLDCSVYTEIASQEGVTLGRKNFDSYFFASIDGYNRLMLSVDTYRAFADYEYILIYQLDGWVYRDELDYWCCQGYDYIGAPWFKGFGDHRDGENDFLGVGNGGVSLRRTGYFISLLTSHRPVFKPVWRWGLKPIAHAFFGLFGYKNNMPYLARTYDGNEDVFYCLYLNGTGLEPRVPDLREAARFAIERSPAYLTTLIGGLPFAQHAGRISPPQSP